MHEQLQLDGIFERSEGYKAYIDSWMAMPKEVEGAYEASGGTWVPCGVNFEGEESWRFVPRTREIAERMLDSVLNA